MGFTVLRELKNIPLKIKTKRTYGSFRDSKEAHWETKHITEAYKDNWEEITEVNWDSKEVKQDYKLITGLQILPLQIPLEF